MACTFDHRIADAYSANMFLLSWAEMAQPNKHTISASQMSPISLQPCFQRSLLKPRHLGSIDPSLHDLYIPVSKLPLPKKPQSKNDQLLSRIYYITIDQLNHIQSLANSDVVNGANYTKLESFSAFLWKIIAASAKDKNAGTK